MLGLDNIDNPGQALERMSLWTKYLGKWVSTGAASLWMRHLGKRTDPSRRLLWLQSLGVGGWQSLGGLHSGDGTKQQGGPGMSCNRASAH